MVKVSLFDAFSRRIESVVQVGVNIVSVSAVFAEGVLTVTGDQHNNTLVVSRDAAGTLLVNGGAVPVTGGVPTIANTTLIRILAGLEEQTSGDVLLDGQPVCGPGSDRGMVFQSYTLFPWLTVKKNVMFGLEINKYGPVESERQALQWLQLVGLEKFADSYPHQLSGGMKQRVAIVRALATQPRILLMDEPFGALDAQTRARMQAHLLEIWRKIDITIVFITHDLDEAIFLSDRILVLSAHPGRVQELIEVPVPRPRNTAQCFSPEFIATKARLEELIYSAEPEDESEYPVVPRLAEAADNVE